MPLSRYVASASHRLIAAMLSGVVVWTGVVGSSLQAAEVSVTGYQAAEIWHGNRRVSGPKAPPARESVTADQTMAQPPARPMWITRPADSSRHDSRRESRRDSRRDSQKAVAQDMLSDALRRIEQGQFQRARQLIRWARDLSVVWNSNDLSPADLASELQGREAEQTARGDPPLSGPPTNPFRTPSSLDVDTRPNAPTPSSKTYGHRLRVSEAHRLQISQAQSPSPFDSPSASSPSTLAGDLTGDDPMVRSHESRQAAAGARSSNESTVLPPLVGFLAGVVCVLLIVAVGLAVVLRRFKAGGGSIFRVEIMSPPAARQRANDAVNRSGLGNPGEEQAEDVIPFQMPAPTSTFADKRRQQQQQIEQQEQALLKHIFDANVQLHGELSKAKR